MSDLSPSSRLDLLFSIKRSDSQPLFFCTINNHRNFPLQEFQDFKSDRKKLDLIFYFGFQSTYS